MLECERNQDLERKIQTHTDLVSRHVKEYRGIKRLELLRLDKNFSIKDMIDLMKSLKESMESKYDKEIELAKEFTKQKELDNAKCNEETKQKELETKQKELETKQKELELEIKRMEFQLEMRKLDLQYQVQVQQVIEPEIQVPNENAIPVVNQNVPVNTAPYKLKVRRRDVSGFYNTIEQKNLFIDWIRLNICTKQKVALNWADVTYKYLGYKTSPLINCKLRVYFEEYIKDTYPNIESKYLSFTFMKKKINGWRGLAFTE